MDIKIDEPYLIQTTREMVRIDSTNPDLSPDGAGEGEIAAYTATALQKIGLEVQRDEIAPGRWNVVGRYNYSLREDTTLERFVGVEYESCCWSIRLVTRRYISRRDRTADSSIAIQLELKGLTSVGDPADELLERGILGYSGD